jgi:hypothetical protein
MIRSAKTRRCIGWAGLFAILLVALAPTVSQLRAASGGEACSPVAVSGMHAGHDMAAMEDDASPRGAHGKSGTSPDDCWKKCGYCGFLSGSPVMGSFAYLAAFPAPVEQYTPFRSVPARAHVSYGGAAQPRGPPQLS